MKNMMTVWRSWRLVLVVGCMLFVAVPLMAQAQEQKGEGCCEKGAGEGKGHAQMEAMHKEMGEKLHGQLAALREHAKKMDGITDEKALLTELKKHQQMTDDFLGSMVEFHEKMHEHMRAHHEHMKEHHEHRHSHTQKSAVEGKKEEGASEAPAKE